MLCDSFLKKMFFFVFSFNLTRTVRCPSHNKRVFFYFNCRMFWWLIYGADANTIDYVVRPYTCMYVWYYSYFTPRSSSLFQSISQIFVYFIFLWSKFFFIPLHQHLFIPVIFEECGYWQCWWHLLKPITTR